MNPRWEIATPEGLRDWCAEEGFARAGFVCSQALPEELRLHPEIAALGTGTFLLTALSYNRHEPEDLSVPGDPHGLIAPFARRNHYREAVRRLRRIARRVAEAGGPAPKELRLFSNSRLPEKPLAVAAGLGSYGRNSLLLAPGLGSLFVIAGMFIPGMDIPGEPGPEGIRAPDPGAETHRGGSEGGLDAFGRLCGRCRACQQACPVDALAEPGRVDETRCLAALAVSTWDLPEAAARAWGFRLYGCQVCQEVCPYNRRVEQDRSPVAGELGASLSLRWVLEHTPRGLSEALRGTALGLSWISKRALLRNALMAAAHRKAAGFALAPALGELLEGYRRHRDPLLARAASWPAGPEDPGVPG